MTQETPEETTSTPQGAAAEPPSVSETPRPPGAPPRAAAGSRGLRQQMLRQVVAENVAVQDPGPTAGPASAQRRPAAAKPRARRLAMVVAPVAAVLALLGWWQTRPVVAPPSSAPGAGAASSGDAAAGAAAPPALTTTRLKPIGAEVFGLGIRRIMIDPGHGGSDTGTKVHGMMEKDLTLDIAIKLKERLERAGFEPHLTRASDLTLTLRERSEMANLISADLFVSVHLNYLPGGGAATGVETYFVGNTDDPELLELARRENAHSGYDMASNNQLLQKLYTDTRQQNSQGFAKRVQQLLFASLKGGNPGLTDRGVKQAPFVVLVGTTMPAILAEVACLSSSGDAELLARPPYREAIADALAQGIRKYADDVNPSQKKGS